MCGVEAGGLAAGVASVALHRGAAEGLGASGAVFCLEVRTGRLLVSQLHGCTWHMTGSVWFRHIPDTPYSDSLIKKLLKRYS